jgi:uncharacterized membrane protein
MIARHVKLYLGMLTAFLAIDAIWLGVVARGFYRDRLGHLLAPEPNWVAAGAFYLLFVAALQVLVVLPGLRAGSLRHTLPRAALFGFVTYATYDLTNLATVKDWPLAVTVVDLMWGAILCLVVGLAGHVLGRRLHSA